MSRILEEIKKGNLDKARLMIRQGHKNHPDLPTFEDENGIPDMELMANLVELGCEYVAQGAKQSIIHGGWEGIIGGGKVAEGIQKLHDLEDKDTLMQFTYAVLLAAVVATKE